MRSVLAVSLAVAIAAITLPASAVGVVAPADARSEAQRLVFNDPQGGMQYGSAVALDGDRLAVGGPYYDVITLDRGAVGAYERADTSWPTGAQGLSSETIAADVEFGFSVSVDRDTLVVGAPGEDSDDGAVYVYHWDGSEWAFSQRLVAPGTADEAQFGFAVAVQGDRLVVGAPSYDVPIVAPDKGKAYVFARDGSDWSWEQSLDGSGGNQDDRFGQSVAIDGHRVLVGASGVDGGGAAYVFSRLGDEWSEEDELLPSDSGGRFGWSVDLDGSTALVGAWLNGVIRGAAYVFTRTGGDWQEQQRLLATDGEASDRFGWSVALEGDNALIGATVGDGRADNTGKAYVFGRSGTSWSQRDELFASNGADADAFGSSVAMGADSAAVGATFYSSDVGAAYTFEGILGPYSPVEIAGATRYETAVEASKEAFPEGADTVVIATGENWPDALGGAALAGAKEGPILLTLGASVPVAVLNEIDRLGASEAIILGGPGAVSPAVETALASTLGAASVTRLGGATRYETAELIARAVESEVGANYDGTAFVATGLNFPDALAGSPLAAAGPWPIFLAPATGLTPSTLSTMSDIGVSDALILGGTGVVSQAIEDGLDSGLSGEVNRLAGPTRYETAAEVASYGVDEAGLRWDGVALATGENFPDALAGGPLQGRKGSVMLLTHTAFLTASTGAALQEEAKDIATVRFLGGVGALSQTVRDDVEALLE